MYSDSAEIKPAQCCIKLVFHLTYTTMHGSTNVKVNSPDYSGSVGHPHEWFSVELVQGAGTRTTVNLTGSFLSIEPERN